MSTKEQVITFILKQYVNSGDMQPVSKEDFKNHLSEVTAIIINKIVKNLESEGTIKVEWGGMFIYPYEFSAVTLTLDGWLKYAPLILKIDVSKDIELISGYVRTNNPVKEDSIQNGLCLSLLRVKFAVIYLENQRKVTCNYREHPLIVTWMGN
jgi:hypothetical protein